jgi:hypothetical protein
LRKTLAVGSCHFATPIASANNTLYLNYENGARETVEIYVEPEHVGKEPVPEIVLGGFEFERK